MIVFYTYFVVEDAPDQDIRRPGSSSSPLLGLEWWLDFQVSKPAVLVSYQLYSVIFLEHSLDTRCLGAQDAIPRLIWWHLLLRSPYIYHQQVGQSEEDW